MNQSNMESNSNQGKEKRPFMERVEYGLREILLSAGNRFKKAVDKFGSMKDELPDTSEAQQAADEVKGSLSRVEELLQSARERGINGEELPNSDTNPDVLADIDTLLGPAGAGVVEEGVDSSDVSADLDRFIGDTDSGTGSDEVATAESSDGFEIIEGTSAQEVEPVSVVDAELQIPVTNEAEVESPLTEELETLEVDESTEIQGSPEVVSAVSDLMKITEDYSYDESPATLFARLKDDFKTVPDENKIAVIKEFDRITWILDKTKPQDRAIGTFDNPDSKYKRAGIWSMDVLSAIESRQRSGESEADILSALAEYLEK